MSKIKIVFVITGLGQGGAECMLYKLISSLDCNKFEVAVISLTGRGIYGDLYDALNIPVYCLELNRWNFIARFFFCCRLVRKMKPDILQTWMYHADFFGSLLGLCSKVKKMIWSIRVDGLTLTRSTRTILKINAFLSSYIPAKIISCSRRAIDLHVKKGYCSKKMIYIPNGFEFASFYADAEVKKEVRSKNHIPEGYDVLGMVARFHPQKDHLNLLQALSNVLLSNQKIILVLCGEGLHAKNEIITQAIQKYGLSKHVILIDGIEQPLSIYQSLDVFVLSSRSEGFPNVLGEAMACELPVVTTDVGDAKVIVGDAGLVVPAENAEALALAMLQMLEKTPDERAEIGRKARERILENYDLLKIVNQFERLYEEVLCAE